MIRALALCLALAAPLAATEYKVVALRRLQSTESRQEENLNYMAKQGWRLVAVLRDGQTDVVFYYERQEADHEPE